MGEGTYVNFSVVSVSTSISRIRSSALKKASTADRIELIKTLPADYV
jgi:hypothetical protein